MKHDGKDYHVFFDKSGKVKNFFSEEQLINDFSLMDYSDDGFDFKSMTWKEYFQKNYSANFKAIDAEALNKRSLISTNKITSDELNWLKNNDPVYLKARIKSLKSLAKKPGYNKESLESLIDGLSKIDKQGLELSINDLGKLESELVSYRDVVNSVSFLFSADLKNYLINRIAGIEPDISVPDDFKSEIDKFLASYAVDDSYSIEDYDLNDLKKSLTAILSDKLLSFNIDIKDPNSMISDLSILIDGKNKIFEHTKELVKTKKVRYSASQLVCDYLTSIKDNSTVLSVDEIVSKFKSLVGNDCTDEEVNNFINYFNEVNNSIGISNVNFKVESDELKANLNRINTFRKLKNKVYTSKSEGYELVDLVDFNELFLFFNKKPSNASIIQAADNLRTLIASKIGIYPSIDSLKINMPNSSDAVLDFIKNYINVKNINFTKQSKTIDELLGNMFYKSNGKLNVSSFLNANRDSLAGLTLDKVLINHISSEINRKNVSWTKRFINKLAVSYYNSSKKLGKVKAGVITALEVLLGVKGAKAVEAYFDERARSIALSAEYNGELPDPKNVNYADMSDQPENVDYWTDVEKNAKDAYDAAIAERDRLSAERESILSGKDTNNDGVMEAVDSDNDGDYDYGSDVLRKQADALDADYKAGINNGPAKAVFDLTDGYERAFMGVDEEGPGTAGLDEERLFTDESYGWNINHEHCSEDLNGNGELDSGEDLNGNGELDTNVDNPFYDDPDSIDDNWGEYGRGGANDGISDIIDHYAACELYAEADRLKADADALSTLITRQSNIADQCEKNKAYADGKEGEFIGELGDVLASMANNKLVMYAVGAVLIGLNGYLIGKHLLNRKKGPLGSPSLYDSYNLESTLPGEEFYVKLNFSGADKNV